MNDTIDISYELVREDWIEAYRVAADRREPEVAEAHRKARRAQLRHWLIFGPCIVALVSMIIGSRASTRGMYLEGALAGAAVVILMMLPTLTATTRRYVAKYRQSVLELANTDELGDLVGPQRLRAGPEGIVRATAIQEVRLAWAAFETLDASENLLILNGPYTAAVVIPRRAFPTPQAADAAAAALRRWLDAGRAPPAARIAAYLADRDLPCPTCTYNLRGISSDRCPECGAHLTIEALQSHAASQRSTA